MPLAGLGLELVARQFATHLQHVDPGDGIDRAVHLVLQHEVPCLLDAALAGQGKHQVSVPRGNGFVGFAHGVLAEQRAVRGTGGRLFGKHHQPGGVAVNAVNRHQVIQAELVFQAHQHGFSEVAARGHHRQKVGFVHHQQMRIFMQHHFLKRNVRLIGHLAVVVEALVRGIGWLAGALRRDRFAALVDDIATRHPFKPGLARDAGETFGQKVQQARPRPGGQGHATRADAFAGRRLRFAQTPGPRPRGQV